jgi:hypothetical protein
MQDTLGFSKVHIEDHTEEKLIQEELLKGKCKGKRPSRPIIGWNLRFTLL